MRLKVSAYDVLTFDQLKEAIDMIAGLEKMKDKRIKSANLYLNLSFYKEEDGEYVPCIVGEPDKDCNYYYEHNHEIRFGKKKTTFKTIKKIAGKCRKEGGNKNE